MTRIYHDNDVSLDVLKNRRVASIGYGNQGHAQSQNLRDSGVPMRIGNRDDEYKPRAVRDGFQVASIAETVKESDVMLILIPDEVQAEVYQEHIKPNLKPGDVLCFASGYNIYFEKIRLPIEVDAIMVAPRMIGKAVRSLYRAQKGFPCLVGAGPNSSDQALKIALALAKGIGATKLGAFQSSFEEEATIDLFAEQMLWPGIISLCLLYYEKLIEAGCDPEVVATELHLSGEFVEIARAMIVHGFFDQLKLHSQTSQYGQLSRAGRMLPLEVKERATRALHEIRSGLFAREWEAEQKAGKPKLARLWQEAAEHPLAKAEKSLAPLVKAMKDMLEAESG